MPSRTLSMSDNLASNLALWQDYALRWKAHSVIPEDERLLHDRAKLQILGQEWGTEEDVNAVLNTFILPFVDQNAEVAEIGAGGGRIAIKVASHVRALLCADISDAMLDRCKDALRDVCNVAYVNLLTEPVVQLYSHRFDFVYSFDVFVHLDLHEMWQTLLLMRELLKPGGRICIHTANIVTAEGWKRFSRQATYKPSGFYFISPDMTRCLLSRAGFTILHESTDATDNFYTRRDLVIVARLEQ